MIIFSLKENKSVFIHFEYLKILFSYSASKTTYRKLFLNIIVQKINFDHQKRSKSLREQSKMSFKKRPL